MTVFQSIGCLLALCAACAFLNQRFMRWPQVLAMNLMGVALAGTIIVMGGLGLAPINDIEHFVKSFNFADLVLHGILGLLLFAGALFVDVKNMQAWAKPIAAMATAGVVISAVMCGLLVWGCALAVGVELPYLWCLLFGVLISPTDPIAALAVVRKSGAPKHMEIKLVGESLFNDATGVMLFILVLGIIMTGDLSTSTLFHEIFIAPIGGAILGIGMGLIATRAIFHINDRPTELLITLALAIGVYGLAEAIHTSAPIAVVAAGMVVGHRARKHAMTDETRRYIDAFWEGIDEITNAALFVLIGLEMILVKLQWNILLLGFLAWIMVLISRWVSVVAVLTSLRGRGGIGAGTIRVMVWGGLRGGISLALALSIQPSDEASTLVAMTFIVVALSSAIQGMTLGRVIPKQILADSQDAGIIQDNDSKPAS